MLPIRISFCLETLGHGKFTREQILEREQSIVRQCGWDLCQPTVFDALILILKCMGISAEENQRVYIKALCFE